MRHVFILIYIAMVVFAVDLIFDKLKIKSFTARCLAAWVFLTASMYAFGAYLVYFT